MREDGRSQTEPLAALVAVSSVALALSLYGVVVLDVLDQDTERELAEPTVDNTWSEIRDDGIYDNTSEADLEKKIGTAVNNGMPFPSGYNVYVELVYLAGDGTMKVVDDATFVWVDGNPPWEPATGPGVPPDHADTASRPVPIQITPGEVQTGTLRVEVWG